MKRKEELVQDCRSLGISLNPNVKYRNKDLIHLLGQRNLELGKRKNTWALNERISLDEPMICQWYKKLNKNQKDTILEDDNNWIAERKWNGLRLIVFYHPDFGFNFFSRHHSEVDFLPVEFDNILINMNNSFYEGSDFVGKYKFPFIIDTEVITSERNLDLSILPRNMNKVTFGGSATPRASYMINSELNAACSIVQYKKDESYILQKSNPLIFQVFDIIMVNNMYLYDTPLKKRLGYLQELLKYLPPCFRPCEITNVSKMSFYENLVANENAEGCFKGSTRVNMADGTMKCIKDIVPGDYVLSYNHSLNKVEPKKVLRKFDNGLKPASEWCHVIHAVGLKNDSGKRYSTNKKIVCTKNHHFYSGAHYEEIQKLGSCMEYNKVLSDFHKQALIGWIISDGHVDKRGVVSLSQKKSTDFTEYTLNMFSKFAGRPGTRISGKGSEISIMYLSKKYTREFSGFNRNTASLVSLIGKATIISWAYAFMCDGSNGGHGTFSFCCYSYNRDELEAVKESWKKLFGITSVCEKVDNRVNTGCKSALLIKKTDLLGKVLPLIESYIHPSMRYKFPEYNFTKDFVSYPTEDCYSLQKANIKVSDRTLYANSKPNEKIRAWDIEVEDNHNYFVENVLVHNCVFKNILSPYNNKGTRHADKWVKLKRSLSETIGEDLDAFVTGYNEGTGKNEGLVGSLEFSVYLRDKNGLLREHVIANVGGLSDNFRRFITDLSDGKPRLRKEMYGKVFVINGHTISARNLRFNHAVLVSEMPRMDKNASQCDLDEETLRANIL